MLRGARSVRRLQGSVAAFLQRRSALRAVRAHGTLLQHARSRAKGSLKGLYVARNTAAGSPLPPCRPAGCRT